METSSGRRKTPGYLKGRRGGVCNGAIRHTHDRQSLKTTMPMVIDMGNIAMKILTLIFTSLVLILSSQVALSEEEKFTKIDQIGRYQISAAAIHTGKWVFVTIIDTTTGKIVTQERYGGMSSYKHIKQDE